MRKVMFALCIGLPVTGCVDKASQVSEQVEVSGRANEAGVFAYTLQQGETTDVLQQYDSNGMLLGILESNRETGATTQTWTDGDRNVWEISSSTRCLSRNRTCLGDTEVAVSASGVRVPEPEITVQGARAAAAKIDLNGYLFASATPNPFETSGGRSTGPARIAECVSVPDILCSTATYCWAMGGNSNCGWLTLTCCF